MKDTMIGVDLAKAVFQIHGATMTGEVKFRKKLTRLQFRRFMAVHAPAVVVMEACGSASYWAREMAKLGHEVRLCQWHSECPQRWQGKIPQFGLGLSREGDKHLRFLAVAHVA